MKIAGWWCRLWHWRRWTLGPRAAGKDGVSHGIYCAACGRYVASVCRWRPTEEEIAA